MSRTFIRRRARSRGQRCACRLRRHQRQGRRRQLPAFCAAGQSIESAIASIERQESALVAFSDLLPVIEDLVDTAPDDIADAFADHVSKAVESGDFTASEDGTADAIVARFDTLCTDG